MGRKPGTGDAKADASNVGGSGPAPRSKAIGRLSDPQVDGLADALEREALEVASKLSFNNYDLPSSPGRRLGVMRGHDAPTKGWMLVASFGLAHETWADKDFADRVELVMNWSGAGFAPERLVVAVADAIIAHRVLPKAGRVYTGAARAAGLADLAERMPHVMSVFPRCWTDAVTVGGARIWFLQLVPVFEAEAVFVEEHGIAKFEELVARDGFDFHDFARPPHVG